MLVIHHLEYSQSFRVLWLVKELGAEFEYKVYQRDQETRLAPADYKALSPLGTAPVITDGNVVLAETGAIFDYILDQHLSSSLRPPVGGNNRAQYLFWIHASQSSMMPLLLMQTVFGMLQKRSPIFLRPILKAVFAKAGEVLIKPRFGRLLDKAESDLAETGWFAGDSITAADLMLSYPMESAEAHGVIDDRYPNCKKWITRIKAMPSYQAAIAIDGHDSVIFRS